MNEIKNIILSAEDGKAKYDETAKELLANRQFLSKVLKRFVPEFSMCPLADIENKYIEPDSVSVSKTGVERNITNIDGVSNEDSTLNEGRIYYDIIFKVVFPNAEGICIGMYINIEAQNAYYKGYPFEMRGVYYAARRLSSQLKGIDNTTNYSCLQKVYSIWICMGDVPHYEADTATLYRMEKHDIIGTVERVPDDYDLMNVIILRINDKTRSKDEVLGLLQVLFSNLLTKREKLDLLKKYGIRIDYHVKEKVNTMCNLSDLVWSRGEAQGMTQKAQEIVLKMLHNEMSYETISKCTDVPVETIKNWEQNAMNPQLDNGYDSYGKP